MHRTKIVGRANRANGLGLLNYYDSTSKPVLKDSPLSHAAQLEVFTSKHGIVNLNSTG